jgi:hypothetical protein
MAYTRIPSLPGNITVDDVNDLLAIEQDITRKITPLTLVTSTVQQLSTTTVLQNTDLLPVSQGAFNNITNNVSIDTLIKYIEQNVQSIQDCFYVGTYGVDEDNDLAGRGRNEEAPFLTIKKAVARVAQLRAQGDNSPYTIFVKSGTYVEQNPIYLPAYTSIIGDGLRRVSIRPANPTLDIFWVNNACYIWGVTFRGHMSPSAAVAFPISQDALNNVAPYNTDPSPYTLAFNNAYNYQDPTHVNNYVIDASLYQRNPIITVSPYTQGCTSYAEQSYTRGVGNNDAGCGMRIDGALVNGPLPDGAGIRSMVIDSFTQVNQGGKGIHLLNHGYAQFVSTFTVCTTEGILAESGATCSISTSNCTFGLSGLVARGMSKTPILSGIFAGGGSGVNSFSITNVGPVPINNNQIIAQLPYPGLAFTVGDNSIIPSSGAGYSGISEQTISPISKTNRLLNFFINNPVVKTGNNTYRIDLDNNIGANLGAYVGQTVRFYARSAIATGSHTFEYMGCGTNILSALPSHGGQVNNSNEVVYDGLYDTNAPGIVYYTSSNEKGNFKVGPNFTIVQSTGTIEGDTFKRSILTLVTPLTIALE